MKITLTYPGSKHPIALDSEDPNLLALFLGWVEKDWTGHAAKRTILAAARAAIPFLLEEDRENALRGIDTIESGQPGIGANIIRCIVLPKWGVGEKRPLNYDAYRVLLGAGDYQSLFGVLEYAINAGIKNVEVAL